MEANARQIHENARHIQENTRHIGQLTLRFDIISADIHKRMQDLGEKIGSLREACRDLLDASINQARRIDRLEGESS